MDDNSHELLLLGRRAFRKVCHHFLTVGQILKDIDLENGRLVNSY